jgi:hypothetical protein
MILKTLIVFIFSLNTYAANSFFTSKKIEFAFTDSSQLSLAPILNGVDFKGIIQIQDPAYSNQSIHYYNFTNDSEIKVTDEYCQKKVEQLYGSRKTRTVRTDFIDIQKSNHGSFCSVQISTDSEIMTIKKRYMMIGFIKARSVLFEWSYTKENLDVPYEKLLEFWNSLK